MTLSGVNISMNAMWKTVFSFIFISLLLGGCESEKANQDDTPPWVKTFVIQPRSGAERILSGMVRARHEMPVAFRINGRIERRAVDAGQRVKKGTLLFALDPGDLEKELDARKAEVSAAKSAIIVAQADVVRGRDLLKKKFISQQSLDRFILAKREAQERMNAALARLEQAKNALAYARLTAESDGLLTEVTGEQGEVVRAGQSIAILAKEGELEIELFFPEEMKPSTNGLVILRSGKKLPIVLREVAGAADAVSHTWRARYSVRADGNELALGNIVRALFKQVDESADNLEVPLAALDERGEAPRIWVIRDGQAQPLSVELISLGTETALIQAKLAAGSRVIALGTHLLKPGMAVQPLPQ